MEEYTFECDICGDTFEVDEVISIDAPDGFLFYTSTGLEETAFICPHCNRREIEIVVDGEI